jgi:hypothetical protein
MCLFYSVVGIDFLGGNRVFRGDNLRLWQGLVILGLFLIDSSTHLEAAKRPKLSSIIRGSLSDVVGCVLTVREFQVAV